MFTCRPIECKTMSQEDRASRRDIALKWLNDNSTKIKNFLKAYNALSIVPPIPDSKIAELHKSAMDALQEEAKILATQVIACEHVWANWDAETCDKMYKDGMEIDNALLLLCIPIDMAARVRAVKAVKAVQLQDPWYKWASSKPWGPHLSLTAQCLLSDSYHTMRDQRWRHLWEEDRYSTLGGNRNERMDAKIEAEEDAATLTMTEKERIVFQLQRATDRKDAAWRTWNREKDDVEQGIGSPHRLAAAKVTLDRTESEFDVVQSQWVKIQS